MSDNVKTFLLSKRYVVQESHSALEVKNKEKWVAYKKITLTNERYVWLYIKPFSNQRIPLTITVQLRLSNFRVEKISLSEVDLAEQLDRIEQQFTAIGNMLIGGE